MVAQGYQQSGLRSGEPQMYLKAVEKFCSSTRGMTLPKTNRKQKMDLRPSTPLKNEELDKRQKRDLSLAKPTNNSQAIKIERGSKIESNNSISFPLCFIQFHLLTGCCVQRSCSQHFKQFPRVKWLYLSSEVCTEAAHNTQFKLAAECRG